MCSIIVAYLEIIFADAFYTVWIIVPAGGDPTTLKWMVTFFTEVFKRSTDTIISHSSATLTVLMTWTVFIKANDE